MTAYLLRCADAARLRGFYRPGRNKSRNKGKNMNKLGGEIRRRKIKTGENIIKHASDFFLIFSRRQIPEQIWTKSPGAGEIREERFYFKTRAGIAFAPESGPNFRTKSGPNCRAGENTEKIRENITFPDLRREKSAPLDFLHFCSSPLPPFFPAGL